MDTLDFSWRIKGGVSDEGSFVGIASPYGDPPDYQNDVVQKGAFAQSIRQQPPQGYPLLWCHDSRSPLGVAHIEDSGPGLAVKGQLFLEVEAARDALVLIKGGACRGISIGFLQPKGDKVEYRNDGVRVLKEVHLLELSCVPVPAAPRAQITSIKTLGDVQHVLRTIHDATEPEVASALHGIDIELKRLLKKDADCACSCDDCVAGNCEDCSDECAECVDCEGCVAARSDAADLNDLKTFAMELKKLVVV
ncbi:HK97 family phage prohead protease [Tunturiibacter gelidoferens]|uniref:Prohead serine protease domain-containing protein n=1 Tax=Tunturiibacter gelidiferens TaxID=3069689 RepID=A0A9X0QGD4_9BACT|nr:HK97 family phage prohead protease [Edaphobacter lichenicola]MBB5329986.1 hypothetical protein [Edaphobacter lichenicola]